MGGITQPSAGIGTGQTYQNVLGSRAIGTTYYNTTSKPIMVSFCVAKADYCYAYIAVDGTTVYMNGGVVQTGATNYVGMCAIVPAGSSYVVTVGNSPSLNYWTELK